MEGGDLLTDRTQPFPESRKAAMLGQTVSHFEVLEKVGKGGMGAVYKARDIRLHRVVALKFLSTSLVDSPAVRERFLHEGRALSALNHPHVATVYEVDEIDGVPFLALEYLPGGTLRSKIAAANGRLPLAGVLQWATELAEGLAHVHKHGVVHRDVKSSNVMFDSEGRVKLTDFGLAKMTSADEPSRNGTVAGTVGYMAPEQLEGMHADHRSDLFSFGVVLYEAATGKMPFAGASTRETINKVLTATPVAATRLRPELPAAFDEVVNRLLRKLPGDRYESADEVARDLRALSAECSGASSTVDLPVRRRSRRWWIAAALAAGAVAYLRWHPATATPSVAVIPFVNASNTPESRYLSDGVSEALINALAQLPDLKVIARSSSFKFKGEGIDVRRVARMLGVQALLTGRVAEMEGRLRITAELVNGADGTQIWGAQYSSGISNLAAVEREITGEVARRLRSKLTQTERTRLAKAINAKPEAYELFLRGRYHVRLFTPDDSMRAVSYYQQALAIDPGFALAHAELAYVYRLLGGSAILNAQDMMSQAEAEVRRALAADANLAEAHAALGDINKDRWDWAGAELAYRRAIELNPNLAAARTGLAIYLSIAGRHDQAISEIRTARELDPLGVPTAVDAAAVYYNMRRRAEALDILKRALDVDPAAATAWTWIGIVNGGTSQFTRATDAYEKAIALGDDSTATLCYYVYSLARSGRRQEALQLLQRLERPGPFVSRAALAVAYLGLDQRERALQELEAAYAARDPLVQYLKVESHFDALSTEPRFQQIRAKIGLPR